jgi:hypothetical protein
MAATRLATDDDGRPVLVKEGDPDRLRREAVVLTLARQPGVVEVVGEDEGRLVLRWAGSRTLADLRPTVEHGAALAAALAAVVADLHAAGIRHGRITADRVVLDGDGRPVLCGFGAAALAGEPGPSPADDVAGVGEVLRSLVGGDTELEPIPDRRLGARRPWPGALRRALLNLADQATADDPGRRPTARALAASIADLVPPPEPDERRHLPWRPALAAVAALVVIALATAGRAPLDASGAPTSTTTPCPVVDAPAADHDGDGCPSAIDVDGAVVAVDGVRYAVGDDGDSVAVDDWDCDGVATPAVVRPSTGEVFVFDAWAVPSRDLVVTAAATVAGATGVERAGCGQLAVVDAGGGRTVVSA